MRKVRAKKRETRYFHHSKIASVYNSFSFFLKNYHHFFSNGKSDEREMDWLTVREAQAEVQMWELRESGSKKKIFIAKKKLNIFFLSFLTHSIRRCKCVNNTHTHRQSLSFRFVFFVFSFCLLWMHVCRRFCYHHYHYHYRCRMCSSCSSSLSSWFDFFSFELSTFISWLFSCYFRIFFSGNWKIFPLFIQNHYMIIVDNHHQFRT